MGRITLIATVHRELGVCNSNELYKIIERIAPEIIFEEVPPSEFSAIYDGSRTDSLETKTIKRYLKKYPNTVHRPVDLDTNEMFGMRFRNTIKEMFHIFNDHSREYNDLSKQHESSSEEFGFSYLNSDQCKELLERKFFLGENILRNLKEDVTQKNINYEKLSQAYRGWLDFIDRRRNEMIKNIYSYSDLNKYDRALFLIGADHRESIMNKILKFEKNNKRELNWNFNYFN